MQNFNNMRGVAKLRQGNKNYASKAVASDFALNIAAYGTSDLFVLMDTATVLTWYRITANTFTSVYAPVGSGGDDEIHTLYFNGYLYYFGEASLSAGGTLGPVYYNGTAWGVAAYTWPASFNPFGGCVHKNRAYFIGRQSAAYAYSGIDSISGATTKVDLASVISESAHLYIIRSLSTSGTATPQNLAAFLFSNGDVLVYSGAYPDSSDWGLTSRFKISKPIYNNSFADAKGDSFIFTNSEILSLRNLFVNGYAEEKRSGIGASIKNRWTQIHDALEADSPTNLKYIKGIYDEDMDRLIISLPFWVDPVTSAVDTTKPFQLIYDFTLEGWYEYVQTGVLVSFVTSITRFGMSSYFLTAYSGRTQVMQLEGKTNWLDDAIDTSGTVGITYKLRSAPHPISKFGVIQASGLEAIIKTDLWSTLNVKLIADLGVTESGSQKISDSGAPSTISKPLFNEGISGNTIQYEMSGTSASSSVGLELYATNLWVTKSEGLAR